MISAQQEKYMDDKNKLREKRLKSKDKQETLVETAHVIMKYVKLLALEDTEEVLVYDEKKGIWIKEGKTAIRKKCDNLNDLFSVNDINEIIDKIRRKKYKKREILNPERYLGLLNGVWDYETNKFIEHNPEYYLTQQINAEYDPEAYPLAWEKFLSEILNPKEISHVQEIIAYSLVNGYPIHKVFVYLGEGANGKSTLLNAERIFLGKDNVSSIPMQDFDKNRFAASKLFGKYANFVNDLSEKELHQTGRLKQLSGGDTIWCDMKNHSNGIEFTNRAKLKFSTNKLPRIVYDNSTAIHRRLSTIDFPNTFIGKKADHKLLQKLTTKEELSGLLNMCLLSMTRLLDRGYFEGDDDIDTLTEKWLLGSDSIRAFITYGTIDDPKNVITRKKLYLGYIKYCKKYGLTPKHQISLTKELPIWKDYIEETQFKNERAWKGIKLKKSKNCNTDNTLFSVPPVSQ